MSYVNMSKIKEKVCRLCLIVLDDEYVVIDRLIREFFEDLLLKLDLSVSEEPVLCISCRDSIQNAFDFKCAYDSVKEHRAFFDDVEDSTKLDIKNIYLKENESVSTSINENYDMCRFCMQYLEKNNFMLLMDLKGKLAGNFLHNFITGLDQHVVEKFIVCVSCKKYLESYYNLAMLCCNTEEKIRRYIECQDGVSKGHINLRDVLIFSLGCIDVCSKNTVIKKEELNSNDFCYDINNCPLKIEEDRVMDDDQSTQDEVFKCEKCSYQTKVKIYLKSHLSSHMEPTYKCELCTYGTIHKYRLDRHILTHTDPADTTMYKCEKCTFETKYNINLKSHMLTHKYSSEVTMYDCKICTFKTKHKMNLKHHMLIHKDTSEVAMYKCEMCTYETKHKRGLTRHLLKHKSCSDVMVYKCDLCQFQAECNEDLKNHMSAHRNCLEVTMYKCKTCTFETKRKWDLKTHMLTHKSSSEVVMYNCEMCTFQTRHKRNLNRHILLHKKNS